MHAQLEVGGQAILLHRIGDDREVIVELAFEGGHLTHIIYSLVKLASELGCDGLRRNAFIA